MQLSEAKDQVDKLTGWISSMEVKILNVSVPVLTLLRYKHVHVLRLKVEYGNQGGVCVCVDRLLCALR